MTNSIYSKSQILILPVRPFNPTKAEFVTEILKFYKRVSQDIALIQGLRAFTLTSQRVLVTVHSCMYLYYERWFPRTRPKYI